MQRFNFMLMFRSLCFALMLIMFAGNLFGQNAQDETKEDREKETFEVTPVPEQLLEQSRDKGIDYLKSQQKEDGSWEFEGHTVGITALCTLALLKNGVPDTDPVIKKGVRYIHKNTKKLEQTYDIALTILLLRQIGKPSEKTLIRNLSARLVAGQCISGGWTYTCPTKVSTSILKKGRFRLVNKSPGDNSCTQFAVLGLWAASSSSTGVKKALKNVELRFLKTQQEDGSWGYLVPKDLDIRTKRKRRGRKRRGRKKPKETETPRDNNSLQRQTGTGAVSRNSMTFAALFCLTVSRASRIRKERRTKTGTTTRRDVDTLIENPIFKKGLLKAGEYLQERSNAGYFFWSSEQLGVILGLENFGGISWFDKGANSLIKTQKEDGSWEDKRGSLHETAFALLFLRKTIVGSNIAWLLEGKPENKFQIVTQEESPRYSSLKLAVEASKENDIIRIDGNGPFKSPHVIINHNLNIQAGFGYEPVLVYESGHNKKGIRYSPFKDVDARNMIQVKKGRLTIEGLRMEMDPPNVSGANISWSTIRVNGGDLQLLNCRISEGNRKGMAAILFEKPGAVLVKNSALIGGRAAIEVEGNGKQEIQIENSLLFSNKGIHIVNQSDNIKPEITVTMKQMTLQCLSAFAMNGFNGSVDFISHHSLFKAEDFGSTLLKTGFKKTGRSWSGEGNIYDTSKWLGANKKVDPSVQSADSWSQFWDEKDINPKKKSIQFSRQNSTGRYSHTTKSKDWSLKEYSRMAGLSPRRGIDVKIVGSGVDFHRFRDSFLYKKWAKSRQILTSTEEE